MLNQKASSILYFTTLIILSTLMIQVKAKATMIKISFSGTIYEYRVEEGRIGDLVSGIIEFDNTLVVDSDPDPYTGSYSILFTGQSVLAVEEEQVFLDDVLANIRIMNDRGCDGFFLDIPLNQMIGGIYATRFLINIQNEFGPEAFTMFSDDSLPTSTFPFPNETYADLQFYDNSALIRRATIDTFSIASVPISNSIILLAIGLFGLLGKKYINPKMIRKSLCLPR